QKWANGIDDLAITSFLRFLKVLAELRSVTLDIVTVTSIACPAYKSVTHPIDALYLGLGQTAAKEFAEWRVRCFSLARLDREHLLFALHGVPLDLQGEPIGVSGDDYWTRELAPADLPRIGDRSPFRQRGTYMIIGANGGLGGLLSRFLAEKYRAKLILVGRRPENSELCDALSRLGAEVSYESVDLSDPAGVRAVLDKHPQIDGIVHSALVLKDSALVNMSEESLMSVLLPKVHGTFNLLNALRHRRLDFVLFFSSIQSHIANAGQANYTAACACKDALASVLNDVFLVNSKVINWGFWGSVGIVASDSYRERMTRLEIGSIEPAEGLQIVARFLGSPLEQIAVIKASDRALERLNVRPHSTGIVPAYDRAEPAVAHNEALSTALDDYSRARLHQTALRIRVVPQFEKLMKAISQIPYVAPIDKRDILSKWPDLKG
ncbi:MAG: SDR family NAD(P)-dependent oxidoreductase, partial [bacterium]